MYWHTSQKFWQTTLVYGNVPAISTEFHCDFIFQCLCTMYWVCTVKSWPRSPTRTSGHTWPDFVVLCRQTGKYIARELRLIKEISLSLISFKEVMQLINYLFEYIYINKDYKTGIVCIIPLLVYWLNFCCFQCVTLP